MYMEALRDDFTMKNVDHVIINISIFYGLLKLYLEGNCSYILTPCNFYIKENLFWIFCYVIMQYQNCVEKKQMTERCGSGLEKPTTQNILITFPLRQSSEEELILHNNPWLQKHIRISR